MRFDKEGLKNLKASCNLPVTKRKNNSFQVEELCENNLSETTTKGNDAFIKGNSLFQIRLCNKRKEMEHMTVRKFFLSTGMRIEDKFQSYQCQICARHFSSKNSLKVHAESHEKLVKYQCKDCEALFHTQGSYYVHIRRHSGNSIICHYCGKSFFHKDKFKCHLRTHTGEKPFICKHCPKKFASRDNLKRHDVLVHKNDNDFLCGICSEKFVFYQNFLDHLKCHKIKKCFKCDDCKKTVKSKSQLLRHMRVHTGKKPYKCELCPSSFSDSSNKKRHMKIHNHLYKLKNNESKNIPVREVKTQIKPFLINLDSANSQKKLFILLRENDLKI